MAETVEQLLDDAAPVIATVSRTLVRRYGSWCERDDIAQELRAWCLRNLSKLNELFYPEDEAERKRNVKYFAKVMWRQGERACRRWKAECCGYDTEDEAFYGRETLRKLLPVMLNGEVLDPDALGNKVKVVRDPAIGPELPVMVADLASAYGGLSSRDRSVLFLVHGERRTRVEAGAMLEVDGHTVDRWERGAIWRLQQALGGPSPWGEP